MIEYGSTFSDNQNITADFSGGLVSSQVFNAGAAIKMYEGDPGKFKIILDALSSTHDPVVTCKFLGADDAALTSNPIVIGSAILTCDDDGSFPVHAEIRPGFQKTAKQYYGLWYVGDDASARVKINAVSALEGQSNQNP